ncbi:MFS transporter [Paenibacillus albiflavus]|uniref:MFS transporter n=1 Tax=Paenibacillus albiflavus TaxID=2545760 RepID=A0A4V2WPW7_9BACL|nr:MFS transporter [Paenibacillus albiflavus]TCZ80942.1 MFS transporter [Paenibacillus albiflavus]
MHLIILLLVVIVAGSSQGLLMPLLTILLEQAGISPDINGLNAVGLYIGILGTMFFIEKPTRKYGYKPVIAAGMVLVIGSVLAFPLTHNLWIWFILRILVGIGDSALHFASQLWIVSSAPADRRGRYISLYGMSYGLGFTIGPFGIPLMKLGLWVPFVVLAICYSIVLGLLFIKLQNSKEGFAAPGVRNTNLTYSRVIRIAWFALIPSILYGFMEATMNGQFPVYGLRTGFTEADVAILLPLIGMGGLILQLPLGIWSDKFGRKPVLMITGTIGTICFLLVPFMGANLWMVGTLFIIGGGMVGSFFSLGMAYAADLLPKELLPKANIIASVNFSLGSLVGPLIGGFLLNYVSLASLFYVLGGSFLTFVLIGLFQHRAANPKPQ